jgi:hypothetical protein
LIYGRSAQMYNGISCCVCMKQIFLSVSCPEWSRVRTYVECYLLSVLHTSHTHR